MEDLIKAFNHIYNDKVINVERTVGSQNYVYLITTDKNKYILKEYNFIDTNNLKEREEQLRISKIWNDNGIPCIQPLTDIYNYNNHYYIIYPYIDGDNYDEGELNLEQIKELAKIQARMHKLQIETWLPCHIKKLNLNINEIQDVIDSCNKSVDVANTNLCVCHNDFKPLNIIWKDNKPYIVDFDAVYKNHPAFSLLESAYTHCHNGKILNLDYYKIYIDEYKKEYGKDIVNVDEAIIGSWNGKLQWLDFLINNRPQDEGINELISQIINYKNYIDNIRTILNKK